MQEEPNFQQTHPPCLAATRVSSSQSALGLGRVGSERVACEEPQQVGLLRGKDATKNRVNVNFDDSGEYLRHDVSESLASFQAIFHVRVGLMPREQYMEWLGLVMSAASLHHHGTAKQCGTEGNASSSACPSSSPLRTPGKSGGAGQGQGGNRKGKGSNQGGNEDRVDNFQSHIRLGPDSNSSGDGPLHNDPQFSGAFQSPSYPTPWILGSERQPGSQQPVQNLDESALATLGFFTEISGLYKELSHGHQPPPVIDDRNQDLGQYLQSPLQTVSADYNNQPQHNSHARDFDIEMSHQGDRGHGILQSNSENYLSQEMPPAPTTSSREDLGPHAIPRSEPSGIPFIVVVDLDSPPDSMIWPQGTVILEYRSINEMENFFEENLKAKLSKYIFVPTNTPSTHVARCQIDFDWERWCLFTADQRFIYDTPGALQYARSQAKKMARFSLLKKGE
ncbi:hypothetical protein ABW19_dt0207637 [Dactylella cylindrospora]|nr:hypothetical protein ABW19_dt0207637 [Dactylella cylindrospora]